MGKTRELLLGSRVEFDNLYLLFADIYMYADNRLGISFFEVRAFEYNEDRLYDRFKDNFEYDYLEDEKYNLCVDYDCSPSELPDMHFRELLYWDGLEAFVDISLYANEILITDRSIYFESMGSGQMTINLEEYKLYNLNASRIVEIWKEYHLTEVDNDIIEELDNITVSDKEDEENYIKQLIIDNIDNLDLDL